MLGIRIKHGTRRQLHFGAAKHHHGRRRGLVLVEAVLARPLANKAVAVVMTR
jgi:hypothetical protein